VHRSTLKKTLLLSTSALLMGSTWSAASLAQQVAIEEIIVTARQRAESLQDVPASITAFTSEQLERAGVQRAEDFISLTPGVTIVDAAEVGDTQVNIRGINGARDAENSFALIIDGILHTNPAALNREYANLQQIEILKGPQGAIYGRNAAAGAIIITNKTPGDTFEGEFKVSGANDDSYYASAYMAGPVSDNVGASFQVDWRDTDGFYFNETRNEKVVDDFENFNVSGRVVIDTSETSSLDVKARYGEVDAASISFNPAFAASFLADLFGNPLLFEDVNDHNFQFVNNLDPSNEQNTLEVSAKYDAEYEWGSLTAWALYSDIENSFTADGTSGAFGFFFQEPTCIASVDALNAAGVTLPNPQFLGPTPGASILGPYTPTNCDGTQYQERFQDDISFEVRLASPADQDLRWLVGAYFLDLNRRVGVNTGIEDVTTIVPKLFIPAGQPNATDQLVHDAFDSKVYALFGNIAYDVNEDVELSVALRYDREERKTNSLVPTDARSTFIDFNPADGFQGGDPINPGLNPTINPSGTIADQEQSFEELQPKISLSWDVGTETTLFANWGIGFKSGGFNNAGSKATIDLFINDALGTSVGIEDAFREETSSAFEIGFKGSYLDDRLTVEGAAYKVSVDDMQFFEFFVGAFGLLRIVNNIDDVDIKGFEFAANALVSENFSIYGGFNVIDSEIKANQVRPDTVGNKAPYTADYTINAGIQGDFPVTDDIEIVGRLDYSRVGPTWFHTVQDNDQNSLFGPANYGKTQRNAYDTVDLRIGVEAANWAITGFAKNLLDEEYLEEVIPSPQFGGSFIHPGNKSRYGVEVLYRF
jgi:iron complex outermembrane recepter protein